MKEMLKRQIHTKGAKDRAIEAIKPQVSIEDQG
jgi:hypothetical protein